jgi:DNA helicase HerA-like ATPase
MATNRQFSLVEKSLSGIEPGAGPKSSLRSQPPPAAPTLDRVLAEIGPLPREALFLGLATDGLPVLLNLHDPVPGPMLVVGESGAGKTAFLQSIARSLTHTHTKDDLQYGVITDDITEWEPVENTPHRAGIFDAKQAAAQEFIQSLAAWARSNHSTGQSVLVLIDDLEAVARLDPNTLQSIRWLLLRGPSRRVWPVITLNADRYGQVLAWIELFRARIFGRVADADIARALGGDSTSALDQLEAGRQFCLREKGGWLRFWLPSF